MIKKSEPAMPNTDMLAVAVPAIPTIAQNHVIILFRLYCVSYVISFFSYCIDVAKWKLVILTVTIAPRSKSTDAVHSQSWKLPQAKVYSNEKKRIQTAVVISFKMTKK